MSMGGYPTPMRVLKAATHVPTKRMHRSVQRHRHLELSYPDLFRSKNRDKPHPQTKANFLISLVVVQE